MRNPVHRLYQLFSHEDHLLILIDPDPDSIASALALKRLLWHRLSACVISPIRPITRPQNQGGASGGRPEPYPGDQSGKFQP